ncbi:MAG: reverse transcriptase domain-containing protein [Candidatus Obscuribacterales bacterium]
MNIPKPGGGKRQLGIPTVMDRFIQQAVMQVLQRKWDSTFSEHSYGFRMGRSAKQAIEAARKHIEGGYRVVVDIDLEKFFDRVNHDVLMNRVTKRISDKRVHKLIRAYLNAGALEGGLTSASKEGYHKADRFRRYSQTCCLMNLTENWNDGTFTLCDTQMTAISTLRVNEPESA